MRSVKFWHKDTGAQATVRIARGGQLYGRTHYPTVRQAEEAMTKAGYTRAKPKHAASQKT